MRADTKKKNKMGKRFAILIGAVAAGVMALGAQTATSSSGDPVDSTCAPPTWSCPPELQPLLLDGQLNVGPGTSNGRSSWAVEVIASCGEVGIAVPPANPANVPDLGCTVRAEGKLTKVKNDRLKPFHASIPGPRLNVCPVGQPFCEWVSGGLVREDLKLRKKTRKQVRKALDEGKNVKAKVIVHATYADGNVATVKDTITLVACGPRTGQKCH
jgi:hypothetical protein